MTRLSRSRARSAVALLLGSALVWVGCGGTEEASAPRPSIYEPTPDEQAMLDRLAELQSLRGYDEGIAEAEAFLAEHPEARRIHYAVGVLHGLADRHQQALRAFETALERDPGHIGSHRGAATALTELGRAEEAIEMLDRAHRIDPDHPEVLIKLGSSLSDAGRLAEAEVVLRRAVEVAGAAAQVEFGILLRRQGRLDEAASAFRQALLEDPNELGAMVNLGQTLIALGRVAEGQALLRRHAEQATLQDRLDIYQRSSLLEGATVANFLYLGDLHVRSANYAAAVDAYRRALKLDPRATRATLGLAGLFLQDGQADEATKWAVHTLLIDPKSSKAYFLLGLMRLAKGQTQPALEAFETSRQLAPWDARTSWVVGDALRNARQLGPASALYRQAIALAPNDAHGHYGLGFTDLLRGDTASALDRLRRAADLDATDARSRLVLALALEQEGDRAAAEAAMREAAALHRLDLLTGRTVDQVLAPFASIPHARPTLERYRRLLEGG